MSSLFPPYAVFSALAILVKTGMLVRFRKQLGYYSTSFKLLFICLFWMNIVELVSFYYPSADRTAYALLISYYVCVLAGIAMISVISLTEAGRISRVLRILIAFTIMMAIALVVIPGLAINGIKHIGFTFTRIPGSYYWFFQVTLLGFTIISLAVLARAAFCNPDRWRRRKCKALLISLSPLLCTMILVLILMQIGLPVTGTVFGSFSILFFLLTLMATETEIVRDSRTSHSENALFRFLSFIPVTAEFELANRVRRAVAIKYSNDLEKAVGNYEDTLIKETLAYCEGNKSATAKLLGISRTTLRRKLAANFVGGSDRNSDLEALKNEIC